ncbi:outer membrane beta-barrel family protein [Rhabdobacter roseus]|uniref:Outer membrane receptor protein involved in Fe transport n=1 Tax=Rhabdobacter roseus TaxID=1655419 RepID=A0A840TMX3_9BACT|nr:outer membrane beta-barrel family protein [Rhabdobacter roseus]MBB5285616.1 outer membrane receptor protein involved in Fe transport [Rhabdobacter roseus]
MNLNLQSTPKGWMAALAVAVLLLLSPGTWAQSTPVAASLTGSVADSASGKKLDFITVHLLTGPGTPAKVDYTKADGTFTFTGLAPARYVVSVVGVGYLTKNLPVDLTDSTQRRVDLGRIDLSPATVGLKEVTVTAAKPIITQEVDRLTYDIQADPENKVFNVLEMMRKVPLLALDADDNILLKGNTDFRILINGKPSSMVERSYKDILRAMPASTIQRIEVITTPPAKYDAEGLAGIINIITNKKIDNGYNGSVNVSERFPIGGPGLGGTFTAKLGKWGLSALGGANLYAAPTTRNAIRRTTTGLEPTYLVQDGTQRSESQNGYLGYELSYELDSLNLFSGQFNINGSRSNGRNGQESRLTGAGVLLQQYYLDNLSEGNGIGMDAALNYQRGFKADKNRLLTFSYRYFSYQNEQENALAITEAVRYFLPNYRQLNDQRFSEQTYQVDYVYPVRKLSVEVGAKAILRTNASDFQHRNQNAETGQFEVQPGLSNTFRNEQNVFGAYNTYQYNFKKWSVKAGVRVEQTVIQADFLSSELRVRQNYFNVIPSVSVNRKLKGNKALNLGYTQRIQRPGIYQLNPFVDRSNPNFERTGNPNLRPALVNDAQLGFNWSKKASVNGGLGFTFFRDLIFPVSVYDSTTQITRTSFGNTGRAKLPSASLNINYPVTKRWNMSLNSRAAYGMVEGLVNGVLIKNQGLMYNVNFSTGYRLEKDWRVNANLNLNGPNVNLQGTSNRMFASSFSVNKDVVKDKLSFSASVNNPFTKFRRDYRESFGPDFIQSNERWDYFRTFSGSFNYKFGKLKEGIKKSKRGIRNDDVQNGN